MPCSYFSVLDNTHFLDFEARRFTVTSLTGQFIQKEKVATYVFIISALTL